MAVREGRVYQWSSCWRGRGITVGREGAILIELSGTKHNNNRPNQMWRIIERFDCFRDHENATINQEGACIDLQIFVHILCSFIAIDNIVI